VVTRGGVYWVGVDNRRPCVVISSSEVLDADVWQTHVVPVTSNVVRAGIAGNVLLPAAHSGLPRDSVAVPLGLELVDRSLLAAFAAQLPAALVAAIDDGVRAILGLAARS
jgi:mRNA interferase MazF